MLSDDAVKLYRDYAIECRLMAELGTMAHHADPTFGDKYKRHIVSLQKMVATYLRKNILKPPVRTSNWELPLTKEQIECAQPAFIFPCITSTCGAEQLTSRM